MTEYALRVLMAILMAGVVFARRCVPALAQEAAEAHAVLEKAALVVIAPPKTDIARIIKASLQKAYYAAKPDTRAYTQAQKLYFFYGARGFEPLWLIDRRRWQLRPSRPTPARSSTCSRAAELEGLRPSDYLTADLDPAAAGTDPTKLAAARDRFLRRRPAATRRTPMAAASTRSTSTKTC